MDPAEVGGKDDTYGWKLFERIEPAFASGSDEHDDIGVVPLAGNICGRLGDVVGILGVRTGLVIVGVVQFEP